MKVFGRCMAFAFAGAGLAAGVLTTPATADADQTRTLSATVTIHTRGDGTQPPAELGNPKEWGVVKLTMDDSAGSITPKTIVEVGGGKWSFGWNAVTDGKDCYSNYYHPKVGHSSTAKIAGGSDYDWSRANQTSSAHVTGGGAYTCYAYWSKDKD
ncbi:lactococcin 972-like bacteriocin [Streptomyces puniciscabiei]|uniref:Lactococcin 972-like bacteriocin n=1 Tax=Streptomyces puniciscabiei TaxID=164348 RepID=A0A542UGL7_9ACTN|nr:lactococcin 972 family bacteriocin [Streptomyces puniciscabiei]TQK98184.1 lactococcin 972-like bacteriocin [Streptomyces puniciscabiei]